MQKTISISKRRARINLHAPSPNIIKHNQIFSNIAYMAADAATSEDSPITGRTLPSTADNALTPILTCQVTRAQIQMQF